MIEGQRRVKDGATVALMETRSRSTITTDTKKGGEARGS